VADDDDKGFKNHDDSPGCDDRDLSRSDSGTRERGKGSIGHARLHR